jgi:hypothetical protein
MAQIMQMPRDAARAVFMGRHIAFYRHGVNRNFQESAAAGRRSM